MNESPGDRLRHRCSECGRKVSGTVAPRRCRVCAAGHRRRWTEDIVVERACEWIALYGAMPCAEDWNPPMARRRGHSERVRRFREARGYWPHYTTVRRLFGPWGELARRVGIEPRRPGERPAAYTERMRRARVFAVKSDKGE